MSVDVLIVYTVNWNFIADEGLSTTDLASDGEAANRRLKEGDEIIAKMDLTDFVNVWKLKFWYDQTGECKTLH